MKKFRYFIILAAILMVLPMGFVLAGAAQLEVNYPSLPDVGTLTSGTKLAQYIQYVFTFAFMTAGIIGVISIVIAGFQKLLYAGSPGKSGEANERIFNSILGIVILMTSFILLRTINPSFITPTTITLPPNPGVFLIAPAPPAVPPPGAYGNNIAYAQEGEYIYMSAPKSDNDDRDTEALGLNRFFYYCPPGTGGNLLLWLYDQPNWIITQNATTITIPCGNIDPGNAIDLTLVESYYWEYENAGVYYYMTQDCTGVSSWYDNDSPAQTISGDIPWFNIDQIDDPNLDQSVRSIRILNDPSQNFNYGVVLTQGIDLGGECSEPIINPNSGSRCVTIGDPNYPQTLTLDGEPFNPYGARIIKQDQNPNSNPRNWGLTFWSNNKEYTLSQYGSLDLSGNPDPTRDIGFMWKYDKNSQPANIDFPDNGLDPTDPNYIQPVSLPNDGNLDNALRFLGNQANDYFQPVPEDECMEFRPENPFIHDSTYKDPLYENPLDGRGYLSCVNKITWVGNYNVVLYTHNEQIEARSCQIFDEQFLIYDSSVTPPYISIPEIFSQFQTIYKTVVVPISSF